MLDDSLLDAVILVILLTCAAGPLLTRFVGERLTEAQATEDGAVNEPRL